MDTFQTSSINIALLAELGELSAISYQLTTASCFLPPASCFLLLLPASCLFPCDDPQMPAPSVCQPALKRLRQKATDERNPALVQEVDFGAQVAEARKHRGSFTARVGPRQRVAGPVGILIQELVGREHEQLE